MINEGDCDMMYLELQTHMESNLLLQVARDGGSLKMLSWSSADGCGPINMAFYKIKHR